MTIKQIFSRAAWVAVGFVVLLSGCGADTPEQLVTSAKSYLAKNDQNAAVIQLKNALEKKPDLAEARFLLGNTLLQQGNVPAAEKELRRAQELGFTPDEVIPPLAQAILAMGQPEVVIDRFGKAELTTPKSRAALKTTLGEAQLMRGQSAAARAAFDAALNDDPGYAPAMRGQAQVEAANGNLPLALTLAEKSAAVSPGAPTWQLIGAIRQAQGKPGEAMEAYKKAIAAGSGYVPARIALVVLLIQEQKFDDANTALSDLEKIGPKLPQTYHLKATLAFQRKEFSAAREAIQHELRLVPDNLAALALAGAIDLELGLFSSAESSLVKVLNAAPKAMPVRRLLIATYLRSGQRSKAAEVLKPIRDNLGENPEMLALAGQVALANGETPQAAKYFEKAAALAPDDARTRTALGLTRIATGQSEAGFKELEAAVGLDRGNRADLALIAASLRKGDIDRALSAIADLEKKQPDNPLPHALEGGARLAQRDPAGARKSYESALELDPAYFPAALSLARLDLADQKPEDARKRFESVLAKDPKNVKALLAIAELRARAGAPPAEVLELITKAVAAGPTEPSTRLALVNFYLRSKEPRRAVAAAQDGLVAIRDSPELTDALGFAQMADGNADAALETYRSMARKNPSSPVPLVRMASIQAGAKDNASAVSNLRRALELKPDLVDAQRALAALYARMDKIDEAVKIARTVQQQRPKAAVGYDLEGDLRASRKEWDAAITAYRSAVRQAGAANSAVNLYFALASGKSTQDANNFALTWLKDHPRDVVFRMQLAQMRIANQEFSRALVLYQEVLGLQPDNAIALNNAAWSAGQVKDPKALSYAEKAHKLAPNDPAIMDTYGTLLAASGETGRGIELLRKAVGLAPKQPGLRLNLVKALLKDGKKSAAKQELEPLISLGDSIPQHAEVAELMRGL